MQEQPGASATTSDAVGEPLPQAPEVVPSIDVPATDVLITEQEVTFSTAAAVATRRQGAGHLLLASLWRVLGGWTNASHGVRTPRRTTSSAPACPVKSTAYERSDKASARLYS